MFQGFYQVLWIKNRERQIYKIAKGRERKIRNLDKVKCIKKEEGKVLVADGNIKEKWKSYFCKPFNEEQRTSIDMGDLTTQEEGQNFFFYHWIREVGIKKALKKMDNRKAMSFNNIPIEI